MTDQPGLPKAGSAAKLPYHRPALTDLGSLADITNGPGSGPVRDAVSYTTSVPPS